MSSVSLAWPGSVSLGVAALLLHLPSQRIVWATAWCPCQQSCVPSGDSRRESIFLLLPLRKLPTSLGVWLLASSATSSDIYFCHVSFSLLLLSYVDLCNDTGPTWVIQGNLPTSRSSTSSHLQSPFGHVRSSFYRVGDLFGNFLPATAGSDILAPGHQLGGPGWVSPRKRCHHCLPSRPCFILGPHMLLPCLLPISPNPTCHPLLA